MKNIKNRYQLACAVFGAFARRRLAAHRAYGIACLPAPFARASLQRTPAAASAARLFAYATGYRRERLGSERLG